MIETFLNWTEVEPTCGLFDRSLKVPGPSIGVIAPYLHMLKDIGVINGHTLAADGELGWMCQLCTDEIFCISPTGRIYLGHGLFLQCMKHHTSVLNSLDFDTLANDLNNQIGADVFQ